MRVDWIPAEAEVLSKIPHDAVHATEKFNRAKTGSVPNCHHGLSIRKGFAR